jgi:hypothetical protein
LKTITTDRLTPVQSNRSTGPVIQDSPKTQA